MVACPVRLPRRTLGLFTAKYPSCPTVRVPKEIGARKQTRIWVGYSPGKSKKKRNNQTTKRIEPSRRHRCYQNETTKTDKVENIHHRRIGRQIPSVNKVSQMFKTWNNIVAIEISKRKNSLHIQTLLYPPLDGRWLKSRINVAKHLHSNDGIILGRVGGIGATYLTRHWMLLISNR